MQRQLTYLEDLSFDRVTPQICDGLCRTPEKLKPIDRPMELARERDPSVNYLVVNAIPELLEREEKGYRV